MAPWVYVFMRYHAPQTKKIKRAQVTSEKKLNQHCEQKARQSEAPKAENNHFKTPATKIEKTKCYISNQVRR